MLTDDTCTDIGSNSADDLTVGPAGLPVPTAEHELEPAITSRITSPTVIGTVDEADMETLAIGDPSTGPLGFPLIDTGKEHSAIESEVVDEHEVG